MPGPRLGRTPGHGVFQQVDGAQSRGQADRRQGARQPAPEAGRGQCLQRGRRRRDRQALRPKTLEPWGIVLAGGASSRMGALKPLMPFRGATLIDAVIAHAAPQVGRLGIDVARGEEPLFRARYGEAVVPDVFDEKLGPLCGIVTGLAWSESQWLATFPCDAPFLHGALAAFDGVMCDIAAPDNAFFNVNTREELARAEGL